MPVAEFLELLEINLLGQVPQRLVGLLRVAIATQGVNHPLPAVCHTRHLHDACLCLNARQPRYRSIGTGFPRTGVAHMPAVSPRDEILTVALDRHHDAVFDRA